MNPERLVVLLGPVSADPAESVSTVNRAFLEGLADRYRFIALNASRRHGATRQSRLNAVNSFYFLKQLVLWLVQLVGHRPDLAHYAISSGWALEKGFVFLKCARRLGVRTIGHLYAGDFIDYVRSISSVRRQYALLELRRLDGLVVLSESWRDRMVQEFGLPKAKVFVVNIPIEREFERAALQMPAGRNGNAVLSFGVMGRLKGIFDLLRATEIAAQHTELRMYLVGPEREPNIFASVQQYITDHSLGSFVGVRRGVSGQEKLGLFAGAGVFVLPSYVENFPLVVLEAAAAGQAIITTPVGAIPEFFQDRESAVFVQPGNARQIANALVRLLEQPQERLRLARGARRVFTTRLSRERITADMDRVYQTILSCPRA